MSALRERVLALAHDPWWRTEIHADDPEEVLALAVMRMTLDAAAEAVQATNYDGTECAEIIRRLGGEG